MTLEAMIRLMSAPLETAMSAMSANSLGGSANGALSTTSSRGPLDSASWAVGTKLGRRHYHRGGERNEQVDDAGGEQAAEDRAGVDPARMAHLLGDVDRVVETDQGVECQDRSGQNGRN